MPGLLFKPTPPQLITKKKDSSGSTEPGESFFTAIKCSERAISVRCMAEDGHLAVVCCVWSLTDGQVKVGFGSYYAINLNFCRLL